MPFFFSFCEATASTRQSDDRRRHHRDVDRQIRLGRGQHLGGALDGDQLDPGRVASCVGPETRIVSAPSAASAAAIAWPCLPDEWFEM